MTASWSRSTRTCTRRRSTGIAAVGDRAVMHPAAHDEPALHLPVFRRTMTAVQGTRVPHPGRARSRPTPVSGRRPAAGRRRPRLRRACPRPRGRRNATGRVARNRRPSLPALPGEGGRAEGHDRSGRVLRAYKQRHPGPLAARARRSGDCAAATVARRRAHRARWTRPTSGRWSAVLRLSFTVAARVVLARALGGLERRGAGGRERILQRDGGALLGLGGGLWFGSYAEFEVVLDVMMADAALARPGSESADRVTCEANFRWPVIIDRYDRFAGRVLDRVERRSRLTTHR